MLHINPALAPEQLHGILLHHGPFAPNSHGSEKYRLLDAATASLLAERCLLTPWSR